LPWVVPRLPALAGSAGVRLVVGAVWVGLVYFVLVFLALVFLGVGSAVLSQISRGSEELWPAVPRLN
jgi:hypothetical protein